MDEQRARMQDLEGWIVYRPLTAQQADDQAGQ
jgi:hypothetical protein